MKKTSIGLLSDSKSIAVKAFSMILILGNLSFASMPSRAQLNGVSELPQERELYNTLPGSQQKGTILDATNPMDLLNRLRRATAMDNATSPSDAIDEALKALEFEVLPVSTRD